MSGPVVGVEAKVKNRFTEGAIKVDCKGQEANDLIKEYILSDNSFMATRFGNNELNVVLRYLEIKAENREPLIKIKYLSDFLENSRWSRRIKYKVATNAGFFPTNAENLSRFAQIMLDDMPNIDILGSSVEGEKKVSNFFPKAKIIPLRDMEPYYHDNPWSQALEGKKVLIIHPFEETIKSQYLKRDKLFADKRILPEFELITLKAVQSSCGNKTRYKTWFDALNWMCDEISKVDFDVAIIGAGAYGPPLASHVKNIGRKGIHLGGATQILFGIGGGRWDTRSFFQSLYNEHWARPLPSETPSGFKSVESGCYW